jgi:hypothetical protein
MRASWQNPAHGQLLHSLLDRHPLITSWRDNRYQAITGMSALDRKTFAPQQRRHTDNGRSDALDRARP